MVTNIDIDDEKVKAIMELTKIKTKKEVVNLALEELYNRILRLEALKWKGTYAWEGDLNEMRKD